MIKSMQWLMPMRQEAVSLELEHAVMAIWMNDMPFWSMAVCSVVGSSPLICHLAFAFVSAHGRLDE